MGFDLSLYLYLYLFHNLQATAQLQVALRLIITGYFMFYLEFIQINIHFTNAIYKIYI